MAKEKRNCTCQWALLHKLHLKFIVSYTVVFHAILPQIFVSRIWPAVAILAQHGKWHYWIYVLDSVPWMSKVNWISGDMNPQTTSRVLRIIVHEVLLLHILQKEIIPIWLATIKVNKDIYCLFARHRRAAQSVKYGIVNTPHGDNILTIIQWTHSWYWCINCHIGLSEWKRYHCTIICTMWYYVIFPAAVGGNLQYAEGAI